MPNWVEIELTISGDDADLEAFKKGVAGLPEENEGKSSPFTFQRIIPMPKELNITSGSDGSIGMAALTGEGLSSVLDSPWVAKEGIKSQEDLVAFLSKSSPKTLELAQKYLDNRKLFGHSTWYEWCNANWQTKWDACRPSLTSEREGTLTLRFETAWSFPEPVMAKLAEMYPRLTMQGTVDEEGGYFYGEIFLKDGILTKNFQEGRRKGGPFDFPEEDDE